MALFADRVDAGRALARRLSGLRDRNVVVLGLPRGGVAVAAEVARALGRPLDVLLVRKLGVPWQPELAMGAVGEGGVRHVDADVVRAARVPSAEVGRVEQRARAELVRRGATYRGNAPAVPLAGREVLVVDDGLATGSTARVACTVARLRGAVRVVLAVPVAPHSAVEALRQVADEVVALHVPPRFRAVGEAYADFRQLDDADVIRLLRSTSPHPEGGL